MRLFVILINRLPILLLLLSFLVDSIPLHGQQASSIRNILEHLQKNLDHYDASVPSFLCNERVVSSQMEPHAPDQRTVIDSIFRLRRTAEPGRSARLEESREVKTVDGRPASSDPDIDAPAVLSGLFEGGLAVVSLNQSRCMKYSLQSAHRGHPADTYVIRFATAPPASGSAGCFLQEKSKGHAVIDAASMEITHLEIVTPHHAIANPDSSSSHATGKRELSVDYAPVSLGGRTFWMPSEVSMHVSTGGFHWIDWSFQASYRNYHRLEVTSRILPGLSKPSP